MEFKNGTLGMTVLTAALLAAAATATMACSKEPQLNVQNAPQETAASAPAVEAAQTTPAAPAGELPAGHPSVALPPGHPPAGGMAGGMPGGMPGAMPGGMGGMDASGIALPPVDPQGGLGAAGLVWDVPASWVTEPPANPMRRAQYKVPGTAGDGELVVFYFGPNQGGPPLDNAQRWALQFTQPDGGDPLAALKTRNGDIRGIPALFVETTGTYNSGTMSGGPAVAKENWALLGAVAQGGDANWFFKFTGPRATVEAERANFESMLGSLRRGS
jgi:hypothetical protein